MTNEEGKQHLAAGADVNAKDEDGGTLLDWAIDWKEPKPPTSYASTAARQLEESLRKIRDDASCPGFGFHDCRHHFISYAVMSGIDYFTIACWVGHRDGGVLIGRVYGHLNDEPGRSQAN
tara:strand:+ start:59 stop:418 length:360 start_codon:yes stop_codon:yes gene_type:complete